MHNIESTTVSTLGGRLDIKVNVAGQGEPVVYLHSAGGFYWDDFLDSLADKYTVYAPYFPGTEPGVPDPIDQLDDLWDAVLAYDDMLDGLGLKNTKLIGHSFGGLMASELAAQRREGIDKLIARYGVNHGRCQDAIERLVRHLQATDREEDAQKWAKRLRRATG